MKTSEYLLANYKVVSNACATGSGWLVILIALNVAVSFAYGREGPPRDGAISIGVSALLGVVMVVGVVSMIVATRVTFPKWHFFSDYSWFLAVTWRVPYFGVCADLGWPLLRRRFDSTGEAS